MDVMQAITNRRSVREYANRPLSSDTMQRLLSALRDSPSACNYQPRHFILVTDPTKRQAIAEACCKQLWMADAPLIVVACGIPSKAYPTMAGNHDAAEIDVTIALDHLTLAAVNEGLGTCWIGAFEEETLRDLLNVPADIRVVALTPVGYPATDDLNHPLDASNRKSDAELFSHESYGLR